MKVTESPACSSFSKTAMRPQNSEASLTSRQALEASTRPTCQERSSILV